MPAHTCHALDCRTEVPPRLLMCRRHWGMVPRSLQAEVYRTVKLRGPAIDETWAPWWRAAHKAIAEVALEEGIRDRKWLDAYLARENRVADELESDDDPQGTLDL